MTATTSTPFHPPFHTPYSDPAINRIYNMLFCDDAQAFAPARGQAAAPWQATLFAQPAANAQAVRALTEDTRQDARVRLLAMDWLRRNGHPVAPRQLLGVVLEVPMDGGLDVLAAYADGSVRYLNHSAAPTFIEGPMASVMPTVSRLLRASKSIVERIGPSDKPRLPPSARNVRLNFLVSDGLYFGEGPMDVLSEDAMAGPVLQAGGELLALVAEMACA